IVYMTLTSRYGTEAFLPSPVPFLSSKATIEEKPLLRQGLVSWPKPAGKTLEKQVYISPSSACSSFSANNLLHLPFQTNPTILTHVQKWVDPDTRYNSKGKQVPELPLALTIDAYPNFLKQLASQTESEAHPDFEYGIKERELSQEESRTIDTAIHHIEHLIKSTEIAITNAINNSNGQKDMKMINVTELEQGLSDIMEARPELGVRYFWGFREPIHGFRGPEKVFVRNMFRDMIPRTRVDMLRKEN
ncbi:hypothetical protein B0T20DRAFT_318171, partial [Sordaria brevicollis]